MVDRKAMINYVVEEFNRPSGKWGNRGLEMSVGEHGAFLKLEKLVNHDAERA
jgi:hypothetical protein